MSCLNWKLFKESYEALAQRGVLLQGFTHCVAYQLLSLIDVECRHRILAGILAGLQLQEAARLHRESSLHRAHHDLDNRPHDREVQHCELLRQSADNGCRGTHQDGSGRGALIFLVLIELVVHIGAREQLQVVARLDGDILTRDLHIAVGG